MQHEANRYRSTPSLTLRARPDRKRIRIGGSKRLIDLHIQVGPAPVQEKPARSPLNLALVLDRSGSMHGEKLRIAKQATLAVLDQLTTRDSVAVVVFDDRIDTVQPAAQVTNELKNRVKKALQAIGARGSTALHEGWLTGCNAIVGENVASNNQLGRCFLLTDGIANEGVTDPEQIAREAAGIREHTGISTSTFGIGNDYNELLLGPMAVAGSGQFHHLRSPDEIFKTFVGELGELLSIAARQVRLEVEMENGMSMDLISAYWMEASGKAIAIGDLQYDEEQHIAVQIQFPEQNGRERCSLRTRLTWLADGQVQKTAWQELHFYYASDPSCDDEPHNPEVTHWAGLHLADRARREAIVHNNRNDLAGARTALKAAKQQISHFAENDQELQTEIDALSAIEQEIALAPLPSEASKEQYYQQQRRSHNKKDYRS